MISFLSDWIQKIAIGVIIVSIFELILPNGNLKKYIKVVLGIYVVFCIISPFINNSLFQNLDEINLEKYVENVSKQSNIEKNTQNSNLENLYLDELKKNIENQVQNNGYNVVKCTIDAEFDLTKTNSGIHKIDLVVEKNQNIIHKIEINLNKTNKEEKVIDENNDIGLMNLRENLSNYYEISKDKISIKMK